MYVAGHGRMKLCLAYLLHVCHTEAATSCTAWNIYRLRMHTLAPRILGSQLGLLVLQLLCFFVAAHTHHREPLRTVAQDRLLTYKRSVNKYIDVA